MYPQFYTCKVQATVHKLLINVLFSDVDWLFLLSIFIGKVTVFVAVVLFGIILIRPIHFGKVGIYGIFVTQSHDFALGIPIGNVTVTVMRSV